MPLTAPADPSNVFTWVDAVRAVASQVDGKFASTPAQVRTLVPPGLYSALAVSLHATASVSAAARYIESISGGIRVSANLPALASQYRNGSDLKNGSSWFRGSGLGGSVIDPRSIHGSGVRPSQPDGGLVVEF